MTTIRILRTVASIAAFVAATTLATKASANGFFLFDLFQPPQPQVERAAPGPDYAIDPRLQRQIVAYPTAEAPGTIIIDTPNTYLYLVLGNGRALRYGIGVGREGFTWAGVQRISQKREWPDWTPPADMLRRRPDLPRHMDGGPDNPLGARAMYLGSTLYRIHGSNEPWTIGTHVSSGCIRMTNEDVTDLYSRVNIGTKVIVLPMAGRRVAGQ
jgi:lipoprotein-anchoring transpeptidase ErfK/SrfK